MRKGQVATEFLLYSGVFLFVVIAAFTAVSIIQKTEIGRHESQLAKEMGGSFSDGMTLAVHGGEGFNYTMTFPKYIMGRNYTIDFKAAQEGGLVILDWQGSYAMISHAYTVPLYDYEYEGCVEQNDDRLISSECKNEVTFYNTGEKVFVTQRS